MRLALLLTLCLSSASLCRAQSPAAASPPAHPPQTAATPAPDPIEKRIERLHFEDAGTQIDELRVGGETRDISVQPRGGMPVYQIQPGSGERSWKILDF